MDRKNIKDQLEEIAESICNDYCKYPSQPLPEGKKDDWLITDEDSPCNACPLNLLT